MISRGDAEAKIMTEVDLQQAAAFQRRRSAARKSANLRRLEKARHDFQKMVKLIRIGED